MDFAAYCRGGRLLKKKMLARLYPPYDHQTHGLESMGFFVI
jgi:hypothetical protein